MDLPIFVLLSQDGVTNGAVYALLALALWRGALDSDEVWAAAHVDDDWNVEKWGVDEVVAALRELPVALVDDARAERSGFDQV